MLRCLVAIFLVFTSFSTSVAQPASGQRRAFVVGIEKYDSLENLKNSRSDAASVATLLSNLGFQVTVVDEANTTHSELQLAWGSYLSQLHAGDESVVFYSGHGIEVSGANYLVPKDTPAPAKIANASVLPGLLISFSDMIDQVKQRDVYANVWIIDACRNNPFKAGGKQFGADGGLHNMSNPAGTFVFYSAAAGQIALDRLQGDPPEQKNSVYTREFTKLVNARSAAQALVIAKLIRPIVMQLTGSLAQRPNYNDDMDNPWCFGTCAAGEIQTRLDTKSGTIDQPRQQDIVKAAADYAGRPVTREQMVIAEYEGRRRASTIDQLMRRRNEISAQLDTLKLTDEEAVRKSLSLQAERRRIEENLNIELSRPPLTPAEVAPNAVFLGKASASEGCENRHKDVHPFGCGVLTTLGASRGTIVNAAGLIEKPLRPTTNVNVRLSTPTVEEKRTSTFSCVVQILTPDNAVSITGILQVITTDEVFFWGTLAGLPKPCLSTPERPRSPT